LVVLCVAATGSVQGSIVGLTSGGNYTIAMSALNASSGFSQIAEASWGWTLTNLASAFLTNGSYYALLDSFKGGKYLVQFSLSTGNITSSSSRIASSLEIDAIGFDPTSGNTVVVQQNWVAGAIQVGLLLPNRSISMIASLAGYEFVGTTNAIDPSSGLLYLVGQEPGSSTDSPFNLFGVTGTGAIKYNTTLQLGAAGFASVAGLLVCNTALYGVGVRAFPNASIDVVSIAPATGVVSALNVLSGAGVFLGLAAAIPLPRCCTLARLRTTPRQPTSSRSASARRRCSRTLRSRAW